MPRTNSTGSLRMGRYHAKPSANQSGVLPLGQGGDFRRGQCPIPLGPLGHMTGEIAVPGPFDREEGGVWVERQVNPGSSLALPSTPFNVHRNGPVPRSHNVMPRPRLRGGLPVKVKVSPRGIFHIESSPRGYCPVRRLKITPIATIDRAATCYR